MSTPHKHADLIKAWADGAVIEKFAGRLGWQVAPYPVWRPTTEYRLYNKHRDAKAAHANGACIETRGVGGSLWFPCPHPLWLTDSEYRVRADVIHVAFLYEVQPGMFWTHSGCSGKRPTFKVTINKTQGTASIGKAE